MYRGFDKKYIVNVELLIGEFYTYSEHNYKVPITVFHGQLYGENI